MGFVDDLDSILLARGPVDATVAGGVGAVANHFFFNLIVVQDGGCTHRQGGTQLWGRRGRREEGRKGSRERGEGGGGRGEEEEEGGKVIIIDTNKAMLMLVGFSSLLTGGQ